MRMADGWWKQQETSIEIGDDMDCKETQSLVMDYLNRELGGEILDDFMKN